MPRLPEKWVASNGGSGLSLKVDADNLRKHGQLKGDRP